MGPVILNGSVPVEFSGYGYGSSYGYGSGSGYGDGSGYGYGSPQMDHPPITAIKAEQ